MPERSASCRYEKRISSRCMVQTAGTTICTVPRVMEMIVKARSQCCLFTNGMLMISQVNKLTLTLVTDVCHIAHIYLYTCSSSRKQVLKYIWWVHFFYFYNFCGCTYCHRFHLYHASVDLTGLYQSPLFGHAVAHHYAWDISQSFWYSGFLVLG